MTKLLLVAVVMAASQIARAEIVPQPVPTDQRIRSVVYNPSEVYEVTGTYRLTTTIEFEKGETVQYLTLGDTIAWQAHPMGHRVHLKPVEPRAITNLTVVTDRRAYYFRLSASAARDKLDVTYLLRFSYGGGDDIAINPAAVRKTVTSDETTQPTPATPLRNCNYSVSGSASIKLLRACDDGQFTYLDFPENTTLPALFVVNPDRTEAVVNYRMEGKQVVIERVASLYTLREGSEALCLFNEEKPFRADEAKPRTSLKPKVNS